MDFGRNSEVAGRRHEPKIVLDFNITHLSTRSENPFVCVFPRNRCQRVRSAQFLDRFYATVGRDDQANRHNSVYACRPQDLGVVKSVDVRYARHGRAAYVKDSRRSHEQ